MPGIATETLEQLAHAVLLPAVDDLELSALGPLVARGCRTVLLGETRAEYLARTMSDARIRRETPELVTGQIAELRAIGSGSLAVAIDHEVVGIQRFRHLLPLGAQSVEAAALAGRHLSALGVDIVLGPIADVVRGPNPWLEGRNLGPDPEHVAAVARAEVEGLQSAGIAVVAKHYPGHAKTAADPAVELANVETDLDELNGVDDAPFEAVVKAGVRGLMLGPAIIDAVDPTEPASCSAAVVARARRRLGFQGTLVSDDLDAVSILRGRNIADVAVTSLAAGLDLLLVSAVVAAECASGIVEAVSDGRLSVDRLRNAASRVAALGRP